MTTDKQTDNGQLESIWGDLFRAADKEWAELLARSEKNKPELEPGMVWQSRKVKRGARYVNEMVQAPDPLAQIKKESAMRKRTPAAANPLGRGVTLPDQLDQEKLRAEQKIVDMLLSPLNRVAKELEEKWGLDRLPGLVNEDLTERFAAAAQKLGDAIATKDQGRIKERAEIMRRGWIKLDTEAEAAGHEPWQQPDVWEGQRPDGKTFLLSKDKSTAIQAGREKGLGVWTLDEIGRLLEHFDKDGFTQAMKEEFPGSELVSINAKEAPF